LAAAATLLVVLGTATLLVGYGAASAATVTSTTTPHAFPLFTNAPSYTGAANIVVYGNYSAVSSIAITIMNPRGTSVGSANAAVQENGTFSATIQASWPTWDVNGTYVVTATAPSPDFTGVPPTSVITFNYTALAPVTTSTSSSLILTSSSSPSGPPITLTAVLPLLVAVVIIVLLMGFLLSRRGGGSRSAAPKPK